MKSQKLVVALLSILIAATFVNNQVQANDGDKDTVAKAAHSQLLTRGAQNEFARFIQKTAPALATDATLNQFLAVVNQYDHAPAQFLKADAQSREAFRTSVKKLQNRLATTKGLEAATWLERVNRTANTITFLWNYQQVEVVPVAEEVVEAGSVISLN